jgi:hypothetical protein
MMEERRRGRGEKVQEAVRTLIKGRGGSLKLDVEIGISTMTPRRISE